MSSVISTGVLKIITAVSGPISLLAILSYFLFSWRMATTQQQSKDVLKIKDDKLRDATIIGLLQQSGITITDQPLKAQLDFYIKDKTDREKRFRLIAWMMFLAFLVIALLAGISIWFSRPPTDAEKILRNLQDEAQPSGSIGKLKSEENAFWINKTLLPELTRLENCVKDGSCKPEELQTFILDSVISDNNQLDRISKISDFYLNVADLAAKKIISYPEFCKAFRDEIYRWQRSYLFVLDRLTAANGREFQKPLAEFAIKKCKAYTTAEFQFKINVMTASLCASEHNSGAEVSPSRASCLLRS